MITDETWREQTIEFLSKTFDPQASKDAVLEWSHFPGKIDYEYLTYTESIFPEAPIALLTNGTSRLKKDLAKLQIDKRFFKIFNSAEIGTCKPDEKIFQHVLQILECKREDILFIDDSASNVQAAMEMGMAGHHYTSIDSLRARVVNSDVGGIKTGRS